MMETLAPDSTDHETSAQQSGWDANSDSGESLFITQAPVPEAVRSERRRRSTLTSTQKDDDTSDSSSDENSKTDKQRRRKKGKLPKFNFPFLAERANEQSITELPRRQNKRLHKSLMRGYFECVRTLWNGYERGDLLTSLPTIDMNEVHIPPISEVEEEEPEDEEFKVVENKCFVVTLKGKCSKSGFILKAGDREVKRQKKRPSSSGSDWRERRWKTRRDFQNLSSDTDCSDEEDSSQTDSQEEETGDEHVTTSGKFTVLKEASLGERTQQESEPVGNQTGTELVYDAVSELRPDEPEQTSGKVFTAVTDDQRDVSQRKNEPKRQNHDMLNSKNELEKKRKGRDHETLEGEKDDGQTIADGQHPAASVCEGTVEVDEVLSQAISEPDYPGSRTKKKKKCAAEEAVQEPVEEREEVCGTENVTKKKKKRKSVDSCVQVELFQENSATEHQADVGDAPKKKKKKKKKDCSETSDLPQMPTEHLEETADCLENPGACQETLESSHVKRKKHKKKKKSDSNEHTQVGEDAFNDVELANDDVTLAESAEPLFKKKKKRRVSEPEHIPIPPEDGGNVDGTETMAEDAEIRIKKKKKKEKRKKSRTDMSEDTVAPGDFSASAQNQLEKSASSFLVADEEENAGQTLRKKCTDSCPEKPRLSVFSAEITGSLEETNGGVRKKKRKKRSATQQSLSGEADYEEPEERGQAAPCDSGVKTKDDETVILKKRKKKKNVHGALAAASEDAEPDHPSSRTPEIQTLGDKRGKTKKKKGKALDQDPGVESLTGNAETEVFETKNKETKEPTAECILGSHPETSSSGNIKKNKLKKAKRRLHNIDEDLFSEC